MIKLINYLQVLLLITLINGCSKEYVEYNRAFVFAIVDEEGNNLVGKNKLINPDSARVRGKSIYPYSYPGSISFDNNGLFYCNRYFFNLYPPNNCDTLIFYYNRQMIDTAVVFVDFYFGNRQFYSITGLVYEGKTVEKTGEVYNIILDTNNY